MNIRDLTIAIRNGNFTTDELDQLTQAIRSKRADASVQVREELKIGDRVWFNAKSRGVIRGVVTGFNPKTVLVRSDSGLPWRVAPLLLKLER